jgi:putative ABC transport system permease protein
MRGRRRKTLQRPWLWLVRLIGVIVPRRLRADWRQEWEAELRYRESLLAEWDNLNSKTKLDLLWHSLGAFMDALWLQPKRMEDEMFQDLRYGARMLAKNPGFTTIAILTLALGIGANTAIFSVVNGVLLRPLPYEDADRLVVIKEHRPDGRPSQVTPANFLDWRSQNTVFSEMAATFARPVNLTGATEAERITLSTVSASFFQLLGAQPALGRAFLPEEEQAGHAPVVIIGHGLWRRRFGAEPSVLGREITLDGRNYTVIGVAPPGFDWPPGPVLPNKTEAWITPLRLAPELSPQAEVTRMRGLGYLSAFARLKPGVSVAQAQAEMDTITARLRSQYPETNSARYNTVVPLHTFIVGEVRTALWTLLGAVTGVLLIACANVANLLLARNAARQKELALRAALGASRSRLLRQLLVESLLLAAIGGALGACLASLGVELLPSLSPGDLPRLAEVRLDARVFGFTLSLSLLTGLLFGLAPAWQMARVEVNATLNETGRGGGGGLRQSRLRGALIVSEVMLSLMLLTGAGLLFRSFINLQAVKPGFDPQQVLTLRVAPSGDRYQEIERRRAYYDQVIERLSALPGAQVVGAIDTLPLSIGRKAGYSIEGRPPLPPDQRLSANYRIVSPDYFRALGIPIAQGRGFNAGDHANATDVIVINQTLARRDFPTEDPVGKRISFATNERGEPIWFQIVGVAADVRSQDLKQEPEQDLFAPYSQTSPTGLSFVIRSAVEPEQLAAAAREAVRRIDPQQPVTEVRAMEQMVYETIAQPRFNLLLLGAFAGVALLLAAAGIYGVLSYTVTQRTQEIGVRMALGAQTGDVLRLIIGQGMKLALLGVGLGLAGALALTRWLESLLFGVSVRDPLTFALLALMLAAVALLACYAPARRAAKVDPTVALRQE